MSQQLQPPQQPQHLPTVITALATARAGHSMVALVRNPRRADRVTPRRAKSRRAKPRPIARRLHHERRWHQRLAPDSLSLSLSASQAAACEPRAASRRTRCRPVPPCRAGGRGVHTREGRTGYRDGLRRGRRHLLSGAPSCHARAVRVSREPAQPQHCRWLHPVAQPRPTPRVSRASRTTPTRRRMWSARCTTSASRSSSIRSGMGWRRRSTSPSTSARS